jgi:transposase
MKAYSVEFRQKIIQVYQEEKISQAKLAMRFRVALSFVEKIIKQWRETGDVSPKPHGGGQKLKMSGEQIILVGEWVKEKNDATLDELRQKLEKEANVVVSNSTISRILKRLNLTRKKKTIHASERYTERVQQKRVEYWERIKDVKSEDMVFIDEAASNRGMTRLQGRAEKGKRAYGIVPKSRGKSVTMIGAIALKGIIAFVNIWGASDSLTFEAFIAQLLVPNLWEGACVILDNSSIHKEKDIRPIIEGVGARLEFLPPYSPDFSPIENCWSKVKEIIRSREPRTYADLEKVIVEAFNQISLRDIHNWFTHCCYCNSPFHENG